MRLHFEVKMHLWDMGRDYTWSSSNNLPLCAGSIFVWISREEGVENNKYFKNLPKRKTDSDSLNYWYGPHHCTVLNGSESWGDLFLWHPCEVGKCSCTLSQTGIEKHRKLSKIKKKVCCGAGSWKRVVESKADVLNTVLLYPVKLYLLSGSHSGPVSFCFWKRCFHSFPNANWW